MAPANEKPGLMPGCGGHTRFRLRCVAPYRVELRRTSGLLFFALDYGAGIFELSSASACFRREVNSRIPYSRWSGGKAFSRPGLATNRDEFAAKPQSFSGGKRLNAFPPVHRSLIFLFRS